MRTDLATTLKIATTWEATTIYPTSQRISIITAATTVRNVLTKTSARLNTTNPILAFIAQIQATITTTASSQSRI